MLGTITLSGALADGRAALRAGPFAFARGGLQPRDLSPLLDPLTRATGTVQFDGALAWTDRGLASTGMLDIRDLDFLGPLGEVEGAHGKVRLTSLAPLRTAPGQKIAVARVASVTPLTHVAATFRLAGETIEVQTLNADVADGQMSLGPLAVSLAPGASTRGELRLHAIDIGALIAASNLADRVQASGRVSGRVPFRYGREGLSLVDGKIATVGPSRLSIAAGVWRAGQPITETGPAGRFAFDALEHLAIDRLDGTVNSLPDGRLNLLLQIQGRSDPPVPPPAKVSLFALLRGKAFKESLPIPKDTKVNLTLDMSLNFAELLAAYRAAWAENLPKEAGGPKAESPASP
jgi:hypothetical protein